MKLRDEIAQCAIGVTETPRHFGQRLAFHHDRAQRLVASLQRHLRFEEKLSAQAVVHDLPPNCHAFFGKRWKKRTVKTDWDTREKGVGMSFALEIPG